MMKLKGTPTQPIYSVGGALNVKPNNPAKEVKKTPTYFVSQAAVSSLPYLTDAAKMNSNEEIIQLLLHKKLQTDKKKADFVYDEKERQRNEVKLESVNKLKEFYQPSTAQLLNEYLISQAIKRAEEFAHSNNVRQRGIDIDGGSLGVDKSIIDMERQLKGDKQRAGLTTTEKETGGNSEKKTSRKPGETKDDMITRLLLERNNDTKNSTYQQIVDEVNLAFPNDRTGNESVRNKNKKLFPKSN